MNAARRRIAINIGGGYVPGLDSVLAGTVIAADEQGWEVVGIRDGFDGLLFPERYASGGLIPLTRGSVDSLSGEAAAALGMNPRSDPFRVRSVSSENMIEEVDRSDDLLMKLREQSIEAVVSVVNSKALSILFRLHRKGLRTVCIPKSAENDVAATHLSFGFNSVLSFAAEMLERARIAARSAGKVGVVGLPGEHAGWLAIEAGMAAVADAVLIPEIPYKLERVAAALEKKMSSDRRYALVVVADGAVSADAEPSALDHPLKKSLAPLANGGATEAVMDRGGLAADHVARGLQRLCGYETYPLAFGPLVKAGPATAVDRHLGLGYGAAAIRVIQEDRTGVMVALRPPHIDSIPLTEAINKFRTVPADSVYLSLARSLGISLGD
jgi:ATP-dependent phosphofructokinase / diphosphate-dependent phosphofructokinase